MKQEEIFGRQSYLDILNKRALGLKDNYRQNMAIIGDELVGKTSIIFKFLAKFHDNQIITLYLEARPESFSSFAKRFIGVLLYNFLLNSGIPLQEDLGFLIQKSEIYIPRTVEKMRSILKLISRNKKNNVFSELMSLCELIKEETTKSCIVIIDEFQNLESLKVRNLYKEWAKLLISQKNTVYIVISSCKFKTKSILAKDLSLLFGNFEVINVEPFDIKASEAFLEVKMKGRHLDTALKNFLVHFTGGYPFYLEVISDALTKANSVGLSDILESLLFDASGILNQRFSNLIKRFTDTVHGKDYISILYLIASGRNKIKEIGHILKKQAKELEPRINRLLELDTVTKTGDFLRINDRVFGFWLKFVYQERLHSLTFDSKNQKVKFRGQIESMIEEFILYAKKPLVERMQELLRSFEDETIQFERKKIKLNHFREIKPLEFTGRKIKDGLLGRSNTSLWIMALKNGTLTEEDISEFSRECKKYRHKLQRKIIVTLKDVDANTRLRAFEEKIWTWDINSLNQMLDLFSKPWVIA